MANHKYQNNGADGMCVVCGYAENIHTATGIDWRQKISAALGCKPGELTYTLDECVAKIEELREGKK